MQFEDKRLAPYTGQKPYIFLSYSHKNADGAAEIILNLKRAGFRVWYDEGVIPATEWDENIAKAIMNCGFFISLISKEYLQSSNCRDELNYARDCDKPQLLIYLEDVELPAGMAMRMGRLLAIHKYKFSNAEVFYKKVINADGIEVCRVPSHQGGAARTAGSGKTSAPAQKRKASAAKAEETRGAGPIVIALLLVILIALLVALAAIRVLPWRQPVDTPAVNIIPDGEWNGEADVTVDTTPTPEASEETETTPTPEPSEETDPTPTPEPSEETDPTPTPEPSEETDPTPTPEPSEETDPTPVVVITPTPEPTESSELPEETTDSTETETSTP